MKNNPLVDLCKSGQSIWYDQLSRTLLTDGSLERMIREDSLRGLTSNPTIFEKAIGTAGVYDESVAELAAAGHDANAIYEAIAITDIRRAADLFRGVYDETESADGYVSLEVSPLLARDTNGTIAEARRLWAAVDRPNLMVKVPATDEGVPAIHALIADGINVNVTLIFSRDSYRRVIEAYMGGLEERASKRLPIDRISSVASFFVSRIDSKVDAKLQKVTDPGATALAGTIAIANAKLAYELFREMFNGPRFEALRSRGARVQRPLWASTGTKNPKYSDVLYVEQLIGPDTVNTVPPATYSAFRDHGVVDQTLGRDVDLARRQLEALAAAGVSLDAITDELTKEGVASFADSFSSLTKAIEERRLAALETVGTTGGSEVSKAIQRIEDEKIIERIWRKDATVWKNDAASAAIIGNSLGWLHVAEEMQDHVDDLLAFAEEIRHEFDAVAVLGMGGSSLCAEVLRSTFGRREGYPALHVLDSTVPSAVRALLREIKPSRTLFIVASKSGTTTEPVMFQRFFYDRVRQTKEERAGENFIAITDPGTQLVKDAERDGFRRTFINPPDIGGRYSALSLFGLVPAVLCGVDLERYVDFALDAMDECAADRGVHENEGAMLGAVIGGFALSGRDKMTLVIDQPFEELGLWIEQLVAESTGKEGKGIVPIAGELLASPGEYEKDRIFVWIRHADDEKTRERLDALSAAGHPVIERVLDEKEALAAEFFVWEFATAVACALLGVNAFDQPNVQESKDFTKALLEDVRRDGALPKEKALGGEGNLKVLGVSSIDASAAGSVTDLLTAIFRNTAAPDYIAFTAYVPQTEERDEMFAAMRAAIREKLHVATTVGYGPRFLHSTGQLHKGGSDRAIVIQLFGEDEHPLPIPNEPFTFSVLKDAQALGDFRALAAKGRRAVRIHLSRNTKTGLKQLTEAVNDALARSAM